MNFNRNMELLHISIPHLLSPNSNITWRCKHPQWNVFFFIQKWTVLNIKLITSEARHSVRDKHLACLTCRHGTCLNCRLEDNLAELHFHQVSSLLYILYKHFHFIFDLIYSFVGIFLLQYFNGRQTNEDITGVCGKTRWLAQSDYFSTQAIRPLQWSWKQTVTVRAISE